MAANFLKDKKFLVIDDEISTVDIVKEVLTQNGAKSTGITNPEQGFGMMSEEVYDAVILDRYMPGVDGHEILEQLKKHPKMKDIPVIMLTGESKSSEIKKSTKSLILLILPYLQAFC